MKKCFSQRPALSAILGALVLLGTSEARADALDELLQSLKSKGVINDTDYQRIAAARDAEKKAAPAPAPSAAGPNAVTGSFKDAMVFSSADGANTMQLTGRVQTDYRNHSVSGDPSTYELRRALLGVKGKFWNDFKYNVTAHLYDIGSNGENAVLEEAWVDFAQYKGATLRVGQLFTPFGLEDSNSSKHLDFMERSAIMNLSQTNNDTPDKGVMLYGDPVPGVSYWISHTNGRQLYNVNTNLANSKETMVRGVVDFAKVFNQKDAVYHVGFDYATGKKPADLTAGAEIGKIRTEGRSQNFRPMRLGGINNDYTRNRHDLELAVAYGPFKAQSDIIRENYKGTTLGGVGYDKTVRGDYVNLMWMITGEKYADNYGSGSFGNTRPNRNFDPKNGGWGAWELGLRFSNLDTRDLGFAATAPVGAISNNNGYADGMKQTTLGVKWILNPNTRLLFNYVNSKFNQATAGSITGGSLQSSDKTSMARAQFDF